MALYSRRPSHFGQFQCSLLAVDHIVCLSFILIFNSFALRAVTLLLFQLHSTLYCAFTAHFYSILNTWHSSSTAFASFHFHVSCVLFLDSNHLCVLFLDSNHLCALSSYLHSLAKNKRNTAPHFPLSLVRSWASLSVPLIVLLRLWLSTVSLKVTISFSSSRFPSRVYRHAPSVTCPLSQAFS
jgi:hypothetical protein